MAYNVTLEVFEGPLDLLLHLIRKNKLDIYDIPIAQVTDQYIQYINGMKELDIEVASDFLVTAATLLSIKARMLLPRHEGQEEDEEDDPRKELVERLLEYERYKLVVGLFQEMEGTSARMFTKPEDEELISRIQEGINPLEDVSCGDLSRLFAEVLERIPPQTEEDIQRITRKDLTLAGVMRTMEATLRERKTVHFHELVDTIRDRTELVLSFMALLELLRRRHIRARQAGNFSPIRIEYIREEDDHAV